MAAVAALLFFSGACALVYQVAWLRELRHVFGASTAASAAVLAVFMGGLGLGGARLGKRASAHPRPLALYAHLELGVAAAAAISPLLIAAARAGYIGVGGTPALGSLGGTLVRLIFSTVILGLPTFLMGGTLPAAAQAVERDSDTGRRTVAVLYGVNTLGAVAGTFIATFALLEILGTRRLLWSACLINALVAMIARRLARTMPAQSAPSTENAPAHPVRRFALIAAAGVGFAFLLMELVWYRMLSPLLGGSSFTFGLILAVALAGIGLGGGAYAIFFRRSRPTPLGFALSSAVEALCMAIPFALGDRLALLAALLQPLGSVGFFGHVTGWAIVSAIVVFPAAFVSGVQFPLLIALAGEGRRDVGREVGLVYAWNTAGAIAGSLAGGFGLLPLLGAPNAWRLSSLLLVAIALASLPREKRALAPAAIALAGAAFLFALGPTAAWRHSGVGVARAPSVGTPNSLREWVHSNRRQIVWEAEGRESSVALDATASYAFILNGKVDGNARGDAETQVMSGLLGALLYGEVKNAFVIGLGTGETAGWLGVLPTIERVDVAELEPAIREVARRCAPANQNVLDNPKVHLFIGDARELLLTTREKYQLVFSEPSNPYRAGIASLFTREFYQATSDHLSDDGLLVQWVQAYSVDAQTVRTIYATLANVFPSVETWATEEADLMLIASKSPRRHDAATLRRRIAEEPFKSALANVFLVEDLEGLLAHFVARDELAAQVARVEGEDLNTDDQTLVEFGFARSVGIKTAGFTINELRSTARALKLDRLPLEGVDWTRVFNRRISMIASQGMNPPTAPPDAPESPRRRSQAAQRWLAGDRKGALEAFGDLQPEDPFERLMIAESLADAGDARAQPLIDVLARDRPVEAAVIGARFLLRSNKNDEATRALEGAFAKFRDNPWPFPFVMSRAMDLSVEIARADHALGQRLFTALNQPFSVHILDDARRQALLSIASAVDFPSLCRDLIGALEPWVPWNKELLETRVRCYEVTSDPRAPEAARDLLRFARDAPLPFAAGL